MNELWSEPRSRLASIADAACSLLARASRVCSGVGAGVGASSGGSERRGFERATRDLLVAKAGALASAAALLAEPEASTAAGSKRVPALVDALGRCGVGGGSGLRERLPPRAASSGANGGFGGVGGRGSSLRGGGVSSVRPETRPSRGAGGSGVAFRPFGSRGGGARRH